MSDDKKKEFGFSIDSIVQKNDEDGVISVPEVVPIPEGKKRGPGRPRKDGSSVMYTDVATVDRNNSKKTKETVEKKYEKGYAENAAIIYSAIGQAEQMYNDIESELQHFRSSKTYGGKNRMMHMSNYMNTQMGLINTKLTAARELNSMRSKVNDLVMKRQQMDKDTGEENSDKAIMDAYYALVNAPKYGLPAVKQSLSPNTINTGINLSGNALPSSNLGAAPIVAPSVDIVSRPGDPIQPASAMSADASFQEYQNNLTPVQKKMIADKDPNIKTVVVYDQTTGNKWFDVINVVTGTSIPGIQRPAEFLLDAMRVDIRNGIASNSNTNMSFPLVLTGTRASDEL